METISRKISGSEAKQILKTRFGYDEFRPDQEKVIEVLLQKKDAMVLMPTGGGKSLCFQIPALLFPGLTVVISPLIALMKDQVNALQLNGVPAAFLNSSQTQGENEEVVSALEAGQFKLLYLAPERLFSQDSQFIDWLKSIGVSLFAIDEAHCISQWGHDFRPEYLKLSVLKQHFPSVPVVALTATADRLTRNDILEKLNLNRPEIFISSFDRKNIHYSVEPKENARQRLFSYLQNHREDSGIIYALTRQTVDDLAGQLEREGFAAKPYHAGLNKEDRDLHQDLFIQDKIKVIVATIAFGMGIDKSNVRYVIHWDMPKNIEGYYQETGRAGRDGLKSEAVLFYASGDVMKLRYFARIEGNGPQTEILMRKLNQMVQFCSAKTSCRRKFLLNYFDEKYPDACGSCDVCLNPYEKVDGTDKAQKAFLAISALRGRFGVNYVVDFLRGSKSSKMREYHVKLESYGSGAGISKEEWKQILQDLLEAGYLQQEGGEYPTLQLTKKSTAVLKGEERVLLTHRDESVKIVEEEVEYEADLLSALKVLRLNLAREANIPAYVIFSDATLVELATYLPQQMTELRRISGFGEMKLAKYGTIFLQAIVDYCSQHDLTSRIEQKQKKQEKKKSSSGLSETKLESLKLFENGKTLNEIAEQRILSVSTIESHLADCVLEGKLEVTKLIEADKVSRIADVARRVGGYWLSPIKNELGDSVTYGEIRAVMNHLKFISKIT